MQGVHLPTEVDTSLPTPPTANTDATKVDTLNVFDDGNNAGDTGHLGSISAAEYAVLGALYDPTLAPTSSTQFGEIDGLSMGGALTISDGLPAPITFAGGIQYRDIDVVDVMLGRGNDTFTVDSTVPASITVVQGGGGNDTLIANGGGGPGSPLVLLGDTTQDGSFYNSTTANLTDQARESSLPAAGNDTIDARNDVNSVAIYGGGGSDTIWGSQAGDEIAGGSGNDVIHGQGGDDHIYGDDGFNLDLSKRLNLSTQILLLVNSPGAGDDPNTHDNLAAGNDTITGDGGNDIIFGDHGVIGEAAGTNRILAVGNSTVRTVTSVLDNQGGNDTIYGNDGNDVLVGGTGNDMIDGGAGSDLVFGDNVNLDRSATLGNLTSPLFRDLIGTQIYSSTGANDGQALVDPNWQLDPQGPAWWSDFRITLLDIGSSAAAGTYGSDYIAGGAGNDMIFGQNGDDVIQGDGSIDIAPATSLPCGSTAAVGAAGKSFASLVGACRDSSDFLWANPSVDGAGDGNDYIEGGAGNDTVFGNQGQDNIIGGSSNLFGQTTPALRPDGSNMLFGGSGTEISYDNPGDTSANGHANDSDAIVANNGLIYDLVGTNGVSSGHFLTFNYDAWAGATVHVIPRAVTLLDYTYGGPDYAGTAGPLAAGDIGGASEIHGEAGDDFIYGGGGNDVLYGDGQNDSIVGGYGNDWISGGTGDDGILGDDGRILASREGTAEPLNGIAALTDSSDGLNTEISIQGGGEDVVVNPSGTLTYTANLVPNNLDPNHATQNTAFVPKFANDIIYGGTGNDSIHGGAGDDAMSGAEAPVQSYANNHDATGKLVAADIRTDWYHPYNPGNALGYSPTLTYQAQYDPNDPLRKILLTPGTGALYKGAIDTSTEASSENKAGVYLDWFLNFDATDGPLDTQWAAGTAYPNVPTDGNDRLFGDLGNDWVVGGTGRDTLWGGLGNDLLNADDNLNTDHGINDGTDTNPSYEDFAYGGGGLDVLIANTGGDRLTDFGGEYNSYLVPFNAFGMATVNRSPNPALQALLASLGASQGDDPTLSSDPALGELGVSVDHGGPRDPQPGNGHVSRDVRRSAGTLPLDTDPPSGQAPPAGVGTPPPPPPAPTETFTAPVDLGGQLATTNPNVLLLLTFDFAVQMQFSINGGAYSALQNYASTAALALPNVDGLYTISIEVWDMFGNPLISTQPVLLDRAGPKITASLPTAPAGGYDVGAPITITSSATDSGIGVATTTIKLDGVTTITSGSIDIDTLAAGSHTLVITSTDRLGNSSSLTLTFTIHPTAKGILAAINDGAARGFMTAAEKTTLVNAINSVIGAAGGSVTPKLKSFISTVTSATTAQLTAAFKALLLSWANDLLART